MKKLALTGAAVLALSLASAGTAYAQTAEPTPTCAQALRVYFVADGAFDALPDTVPGPPLTGAALNAAVEADATVSAKLQAVTAAETALSGATATATAAGTATVPGTGLSTSDLTAAKIAQLQQDFPGNAVAAEQIRLIQAVLDARSALETATDALADERALVRTRIAATPTAAVRNPALDAGTVFDALVKAQNAADAACQGQQGNPGPAGPAGPAAPADFKDCDEVRADGLQRILPDHPRFQPSLDADNDGIGCEPVEGSGGSTGSGSNSNSSNGGTVDPAVTVVPNDAPETGDGSTVTPPLAQRIALGAFMANFFGFALAAHRRGAFRL